MPNLDIDKFGAGGAHSETVKGITKDMTRSHGGRGSTTAQIAGEREIAARLRKVNLDLLPLLRELLRTRSVTRTAQTFGVTQSAQAGHCGSSARRSTTRC